MQEVIEKGAGGGSEGMQVCLCAGVLVCRCAGVLRCAGCAGVQGEVEVCRRYGSCRRKVQRKGARGSGGSAGGGAST